jgi:hypothetical protein
MTIVLTHVGPSPIPDYTEYCLKQLRIYNRHIPIFFLSLEKNLREKSDWWVKYNVSPYSYDKLEDEPLNKKFEELSWYKAWGTPNTKTPGPKEFVHGTSKRLYVLNAFLKKTGYEDIIHIENDVMVYESLDFVVKKAREVYDRFAATIVGPDYMACSFCRNDTRNDAVAT